MGNLATVGVVLIPCIVDYVWGKEAIRGCTVGEAGCKTCRGALCLRCANLYHDGSCVDSCPPGHSAEPSTREEYFGLVCKETIRKFMFGLSGSQIAILVGVASGATICIFIILCGVIVVHRRKKKAAKMIQHFEDSAERREFLKHLATLRGEGTTFLSMLNDTRRQVRELHYSGNNGDGAVGIQAYRPVLRDLARILVLINRRDDEIPRPPDDWQRLLSWAERLLRRYKRHTSPQVAQLVTFLQQPATSVQIGTNPQQISISQTFQNYEPRATPTNLTTFQANAPLTTFQASDKSSISPASSSIGYTKDSPVGSSLGQNSSSIYNEKLSPNGSTIGQSTPLVSTKDKRVKPVGSHLQELAISPFNHTYSPDSNLAHNKHLVDNKQLGELDHELNPQWEFESTIEAANFTILSEWAPGRDYLDDFTILGFRPQDEITTEL